MKDQEAKAALKRSLTLRRIADKTFTQVLMYLKRLVMMVRPDNIARMPFTNTSFSQSH
jgi:hypothetical protein